MLCFEKSKDTSQILWAYVLQTLMRPHSST